ncbi:MAG TPA: DNA-binding response regulator [Dehalococcoidia bacterium]|nr:DNA-binding response regulator [Dehalococcoidia bacterium]
MVKAKYRILILSNDTAEAGRIKSALELQGFACIVVQPGEESMIVADLAVIDVDSLALSNQIEALLTELRQKERRPVIALLQPDVLHILRAHADIEDFILKPWDVRELVFRIQRIIRRTESSNSHIIVCNDLRIDTEKCEVSIAGMLLDLTFTEYELLKFLASHKGKAFSREALLTDVWGYNYYGGERTVDVHIRRLRSKIEVGSRIFIETVRNIGYKFDDFSSKSPPKAPNS